MKKEHVEIKNFLERPPKQWRITKMIGKQMKALLTASFLVGTIGVANAVPQISVSNNKIYTATGPYDFLLRRGILGFRLFDGSFVLDCAFHADPQGPPPENRPLPPGASQECPAGDNALIATRFGDRSTDLFTVWTRISTVNEATAIPPRYPQYIELTAAPFSDLPRPLRTFKDRSVSIFHDLQTAAFRDKDITRYEFVRTYDPGDIDINADGAITPQERDLFTINSRAQDRRQARETLIRAGNQNGYLVTYPDRNWVNANKGIDPKFALRREIAVNQIRMVEAYPGPSVRAGFTNLKSGFRYTNLNQIGTDYDGDPALLIDLRNPPTMTWTGNDTTNTLSSIDTGYIRIFERRYGTNGAPVPGADDTQAFDIVAITPAVPSTDPNTGAPNGVGIILDLVMDQEAQDLINALLAQGELPSSFADLFIKDNEMIKIYNSGIDELDGQIFYTKVITPPDLDDNLGIVGFTQRVELYLTEGLLLPTVTETLTGTPTGLGVVVSEQTTQESAIWPYAFVEQNFGGQLLMNSVYDLGYTIPFIAMSLNIPGTSPTRIDTLPDPKPRNDLIFRVRFQRNVRTAGGTQGGSALVGGDSSARDFEVQMCICDTFKGAVLGAVKNKMIYAKSDKDAQTAPDADYDGDGKTNLYEFAFDKKGSMTETKSAMFDPTNVIHADFDVSVDRETKRCTLKIAKRPDVRETIIYSFQRVILGGENERIDESTPGWEVVTNDALTLELRSIAPYDETALFRACAEENPFEPQPEPTY